MGREETLKIAVGLTRHAIAFLGSAGLGAQAEAFKQTIERVLAQEPWLRDQELTPEMACLAAGLPLGTDALYPLQEVAVPADVRLELEARPHLSPTALLNQ